MSAAREPDEKRPLLQAEGLTKLYPVSRGLFRSPSLLHALDHVSLYVRKGETLGLVGESGSGKSTLARVLLRLSEPTFGRVVFDGTELTELPPNELRALRRRMQLVFQDPYAALNPRMTLREIIGEGLDIFDLAQGAAADARVAELLGDVGLRPDMAGRYPHELSGGQRQRVGIARALAVGPELLICDEPVSALDVSVQAQVLNLLSGLQERLGLGMLFISHDLRVVSWMSHRLAVMYLGRLVEVGPTAEVNARRYHPYTRALFGAVPGRVPSPRRPGPVLGASRPSPIDPPPGCAFFALCPNAERGRCDTEVPELREVHAGSHHRTACFHPVTAPTEQ
jgi:oligopeptide/dipeptide ABC transporter ATP-binding protein